MKGLINISSKNYYFKWYNVSRLNQNQNRITEEFFEKKKKKTVKEFF